MINFAEEEKKIQSKDYLQVISFHKLLFISIKKNSFQLKKKQTHFY